MEIRIFGPPGTGKTFYLCNTVIPEMKQQYGAQRIMITSFTKTAALNIAARAGLDSSDKKHGTLHSICYNAMGRPKLIDTVLSKWNDRFTEWQLQVSRYSEAEIVKDKNKTHIASTYQILRNSLANENSYPDEIKTFHNEYVKFKKEHNVVDFTDMIEMGLQQFISPPFGTSVIIVDEAQDFNPLQIKLIRSWGVVIPKVFLCMDDDQSIFSFQGVNISSILLPDVEESNKVFLTQSFRVPQIPHKFAMRITDQITDRAKKEYKPTQTTGEINIIPGTIDDPKSVIDMAIQTEGSSMIMTSCAYMLQNITAYLMIEGIPFHNPYKSEDRRWNPMDNKASKILYNFLSCGSDPPYWDTKQLLTWIEDLSVSNAEKKGLIRTKAKKLIGILKTELEKQTQGLHTCREYLHELLAPEAIQFALDRDVNWFKTTLSTTIQRTMDYPIKIVSKTNDKESLKAVPKIIVGTIHSFKGTEAENVFVFPDISWAGYQEWQKSVKGKDDIHRLFYVAVTRTKNRLFLMQPSLSSRDCVYNFPDLKNLAA